MYSEDRVEGQYQKLNREFNLSSECVIIGNNLHEVEQGHGNQGLRVEKHQSEHKRLELCADSSR